MSVAARLVLLAFVARGLAASPQETEKRITPVASGRKIALVVGNQNYPSQPLSNPLHDADDMKAVLESDGFHVDILKDATFEKLETSIVAFAQSLQEGDIVFFYYSGHGIAIQNQNFLIPIDFTATNEAAVRFHATAADEIQQAIEDRKPQLAILVLDACRDNPFIRKKGLGGGGLAPMREAKGTLIAFAAGPGEAAIDTRGERNSLYTEYLLAALREPGLSVRDLFDRVAEQVHEASGEKILPSVNRTLIGDFVFRPSDPKAQEAKQRYVAIRDTKDAALLAKFIRDYPNQPEAVEAAATLKRLKEERLAENTRTEEASLHREDDDLWNSVKDSDQPQMIDLYLKRFPSGAHASEAVRVRDGLVVRQNEAERRDNVRTFQAKDDAAWEFARNANSTVVIDEYLKNFPGGSHVSEAKKLRDDLAAREKDSESRQRAAVLRSEDDAAWDLAHSANSKAALTAYLSKYPSGGHAAEANDMLMKIPEPSAPALSVRAPYRNPRDKAEYVWVPGGSFLAGCHPNDSDCSADEPRPHQAALPEAGFWIGQTEVTVLAYRLFTEATKRKMPSASDDNPHWSFTDHPMIKVSLREAEAYCEWAGGRLPSGDEWERAARGGAETRYPWGDDIQPNQAKYMKTPVRADKKGAVTAPVKSFEPNGFGLYDVSGNVWEWTSDTAPNGLHLTRGGSWYSGAKNLRVTSVRTFKNDEGVNEAGFRCVLPQMPAAN